jgi:hypothetical protein
MKVYVIFKNDELLAINASLDETFAWCSRPRNGTRNPGLNQLNNWTFKFNEGSGASPRSMVWTTEFIDFGAGVIRYRIEERPVFGI